jgi:hypothetical protein
MDVHAPHQPIHTLRDFAIHLTIVTIGLFIALSLEALVEQVHHRHLVKEARENIRHELEENHQAAQDDLVQLDKNIEQQQTNIAKIHDIQKDPKNFHGAIGNTMNFEPPSDAAWRTARDTGALGYMPYDEVQRYSVLYMFSDLVNSTAIEVGKKDFDAGAAFQMGFSMDKLPPEEYTRLLHDNASVLIQFVTLRGFVQQYEQQCADVLKQ